MESQSLDRASHYLNNLLLARGLLATGKPIDFARPDSNGGGTDATMSRIINLVHDLVLRRDRDAEQRETLAINIRATRADEAQRVLDLQRLQDKNVELARIAASAESQERALKAAVRKAEVHAKELKEQMLRIKSTLDQVRARCLSDVRKRDAELDKLKAHLTALQRGKKESTGMKINAINWEPETREREKRTGHDINSTEWSLEKETNDFLAVVLNETSTENVSLRQIIADTMEILSDLTGLSAAADDQDHGEMGDVSIIHGQSRKFGREASRPTEKLTSSVELADQMRTILEHCRSILKDPSFVPIEEVHERDEEILKLRAGWEKMASKWREAVTMMDSWRTRTGDMGEGLPSHEFSGLAFGKSIAMLPNGRPIFGAEEELPSILYEDSNMGDAGFQGADTDAIRHTPQQPHSNVEDHHESDFDIPPEPTANRFGSSPRRVGLNIGKPIRPLQAIENNVGASPKRNKDNKSFTKHSLQAGKGTSVYHLETENDILPLEADFQIPPQSYSKSNSPQDGNDQGQTQRAGAPSLTVAEKLAAVEAEANEARNLSPQQLRKRKQVGSQRTKKGSRRRSTLSPEELAALIGIE
ncbi:hypothetical protein A1O1_06646 [Capronia coronata CBS 617.96]|uniref:NIMA interactive protein n=1 Tax=Capronia coronata CBS 617.96 TaxID=1182541 RepID=W9YAH7_9EURO|nr:uncharacterized protein A1O1_06646 [Capronia coronata CBS 617.96]EXJ86276.1 hypothetical protein A1O1_06646 [Capronia coronata CBS 617.96]